MIAPAPPLGLLRSKANPRSGSGLTRRIPTPSSPIFVKTSENGVEFGADWGAYDVLFFVRFSVKRYFKTVSGASTTVP
jgi:hypothetical protein